MINNDVVKKVLTNAAETQRQTAEILNDKVDQALISIILQLQLLQQSDDWEFVKGRLVGLEHVARVALSDVRGLTQNLTPYIPRRVDLMTALEAHLGEYRSVTQKAVEFSCPDIEIPLTYENEMLLFQIVKEILRMAEGQDADSLKVRLTLKKSELFLQISGLKKDIPLADRPGMLSVFAGDILTAQGKVWTHYQQDIGWAFNLLLPLN